MKIITLTCARLNSTRIKHKMLQKVGNRSLLRITIDFAKKLPYEHYIFTKDEEIKNEASDCKIIHEPDSLYDIPGNIYEKLCYINEIIKADFIILLQATSPVRNFELYKHWISDFTNSCFSSGFSVYQKDRKNYVMNGAFYIIRKEILNSKLFDDIITSNVKMYLDFQNYDIDTYEDLEKVRKNHDICN